jgi:uncharacterized membrane protein YsdA (DUF1294 family)
MTEWLVMLAAFLLVLAFLGAIADSVDRRDARRRNRRIR